MTDYDLTVEQRADIAEAFGKLSKEMQAKFACLEWKRILKSFRENAEDQSDDAPVEFIHSMCKVCGGTKFDVNSDRAMAVLDKMGIEYEVGKKQEPFTDESVKKKHACRYYEDQWWIVFGTSPLHVLLLALGEIGGK